MIPPEELMLACVLPKLTKKIDRPRSDSKSIGPSKGIAKRGCRLKLSKVLVTSIFWQSETRTVQSGLGKFIRSPVFWLASGTVNRSLGKGLVAGLVRSKR